ncbi:MAG: ATP-binding cassette domain-containing protein [Bacteroidia bacterium]
MSDKILKALMQLFAIIANVERLTAQGRNIVEAFLLQQLSRAHVKYYLEIFDSHFALLQGKSDPNKIKKRVSVNSVKVLRICTEINNELEQKQKYIVLMRLIEFACSSGETVNEQELEFLSTVANVFNIPAADFEVCLSFASGKNSSDIKDSLLLLIINNNPHHKGKYTKHIVNESLPGDLCFLDIKSEGILFVKYFGTSQLTLNGHPLLINSVTVCSPGSVIRGTGVSPVYYSDVINSFLKDALHAEISLAVHNVEFVFQNKKKGLHEINFSATTGNLIGIMGGSGAGKSTLLNILNGNSNPTKGKVTINGINIHKEQKKLEGVIGYVPQDDLLIEDLTVFQNIFFSSKLCFGNLSDHEITDKVNRLLETLGLFEIKNLKVGDSLNKMISGGQRKRLNIALELIRKPLVLFVDEPTSGLSSLDSENVMDLLKQLAINGNLVFVVIHQPSSDIFKLFDRLLILDIGGYPVYYGNPSDSLIYFKNKANYADADESECETCGNINPEQVFNIIESKVIDEFGNATRSRKISPEEWNSLFKESHTTTTGETKHKKITQSIFSKPSRLKQIAVFIQRDVFAKLRNVQYLLINFLEAPLLALILSYFLKYYKEDTAYLFRENLNLPAFIFISVIVALFMGLTVSAEEIIHDRKILKRESFLHLSRSSYLFSKISIMFLISAIQTFSFVIIGNAVFGIKDMFFEYWLILFSVSCFANLMGLIISASFDSVVTIYILIPFLIIPQIILSGVMVKFENLNPVVTSQSKVPLIGEVMVSRWAFEALAVNQFKNNLYEQNFFEADKEMSNATYKKDFWLLKMNDKLDSAFKARDVGSQTRHLKVVKTELNKNSMIPSGIDISGLGSLNEAQYKKIKSYLEHEKKSYIHQFNRASAQKDSIVKAFSKSLGTEKLKWLKDHYTNESLNDLVLNANDFNVLVENNDEFIQRFRPVFTEGANNSFVRAPFYVSAKSIFGKKYDTYCVNLIVIWVMSALLAVVLYFNVLRKLLSRFGG